MRNDSTDLKLINLVVLSAEDHSKDLQYLSRDFRVSYLVASDENELRAALALATDALVPTAILYPLETPLKTFGLRVDAILRVAQSVRPEWPFLVLADLVDGEKASQLMRSGVADIISPAHLESLRTVVQRALSDIEARQMRRQAETSMMEAEARYRTITESAFDLIAEFDAEGRFLYHSTNYPLVLGYGSGELLGYSLFDRVHPDDHEKLVSEFTAALHGTRSGEMTYRWEHKSGGYRWFESTLRTIRGVEGSRRVVQVSRDITSHKRHEEELASLIALAKAINAQSQLRGIAQELCSHLPPLLPFDAIYLAVAKELDFDAPQEFQVVGYSGSTGDLPSTPLRRQLQPEHTMWTSFDKGEVRLVNGWNGKTPTFFPNSRAFLDVPLRVDEQLLGMLHFASVRPFAFIEAHAHLASMVGEQVAVAVHQTLLLSDARQAREKFRSLVNDVNAIVWEADPIDMRLTYLSPQVEVWLGYAPERLMYDRDLWQRVIHPDDRERVAEEGKRSVEAGEDFQVDYRVLASDGSTLWLRSIASVETQEVDGRRKAVRVRGVAIDITLRKVAENRLRESNAVLKATQEASADGICLLDAHGSIVSCNSRFRELWRIPDELADARRGIMGRVLSELKQPGEFIDKINFLQEHTEASSRDEITLKDGRIFERYSSPALGPEGNNYGRVWIFSDVTERKQYEHQLAHQAYHDPLTNLPNRTLFSDRVNHAIAHLGRAYESIAVLFLDLDRFKVINDSMGHEKGDQLLQEMARRLQNSMRPGDTAARFGGDEFTLLVEGINGVEDAVAVAERIVEALNEPFMLDSREVYVSSSIGIAVTSSATDTAEDLLRNADIAMYRAKNKGKARYEIFDMKMSAAAFEKLQLEIELRQAVKWQQLRLDYQPLIDLETDKIVGVEALVRWDHPQRGLVPPSDFIPIAEESGMIVSIGKWVLHEACAQARRWQIEVPTQPELRMSVNLSAKQFQQSDIVGDVQTALTDTGLEAHLLELEITESAIMEDADSTIELLEKLKRLGVKLAVDDFGTGYSSLAYIERFPLDVLKIDRSFVAQIGLPRNGNGSNGHAANGSNGHRTNGHGANGHTNGVNGHGTNGNGSASKANGQSGKSAKNGKASRSDASVVMQAVSTLGIGLGVSITAEGIETAEQLQHLRELGCDIGQGFLFAKPLSGEDLATLLRKKLSEMN
jgi:diguanylate cyclase (GGDEF)-like protein/PAS domain S-box-containing protein